MDAIDYLARGKFTEVPAGWETCAKTINFVHSHAQSLAIVKCLCLISSV